MIDRALQPTSDTERYEILDILRGFALYGVLLANLVWLTTDKVLSDARLEQLPTAPVDPIARALVAFFIDGKFYTLFPFLFGLGCTGRRCAAPGLCPFCFAIASTTASPVG